MRSSTLITDVFVLTVQNLWRGLEFVFRGTVSLCIAIALVIESAVDEIMQIGGWKTESVARHYIWSYH